MNAASNFSNVVNDLSALTSNACNGVALMPSGKFARFTISHRFDDDELSEIEMKWEFELPNDYRAFLVQIGCGVFFIDPNTNRKGIELRRIDDLCSMVAAIESPPVERPFRNFVPVGRNLDSGDALVMGSSAASRGRMYSISTLPRSWHDVKVDYNRGLAFADWITRLIGGPEKGS